MSNHYEVEAIMSKKTQNGVQKYLVKWKGFSHTQNTWEPLEHFSDLEMIQEFNKKWELKNQTMETTKNKIVTSAKSGNSASQRSYSNAQQKSFQYGEISEENNTNLQSKLGLISTQSKQRQSYEITAPNMTIQGLYVDPEHNFWFNITNNRKKTTVSRQQAINMNFMAILSFYQKNIKFYAK